MVTRAIRAQRWVWTWVVLVILAVVIPIISIETHGGTAAAVIVLALAAYKVRLVGLDFMELRTAPRQLRLVFELYCLGMWLVLAGAYVLL
ncbi:cytochrome C oxidase subunit IV family protein [Gordonia sp. ABSL1-1]|uniref:cytochrome C oxidase subunit IV family protein n=1 Tax=Gordonia sp. ABSL1-1 TaxID=3053923 RepID=UPI002573E159|nr:cytochrome C oxidase subunit IV family protein [Gordonia sp. ABSL1-1]MDL9938100.1 cytochrome C oxidase subunit IV family protein [Gordonia sp. ABSL1-1]